MPLDNRTLLFSLMIVHGIMAISIAIVSRPKDRDGLRKWAIALTLESIAWFLILVRGMIPDLLSILLANLILASAFATKLAAIYEYRCLPWPRIQTLLPLLATCIALILLQMDDFQSRLILGSLIYATQAFMIAHALWNISPRHGRAWMLPFASHALFVLISLIRGIAALSGKIEFANVQSNISPNSVQLSVFIFVIALGIMGSMGFVLMIKERADREIHHLAMTDSLTQLLNRRAFMKYAEKEQEFARRNQLPLSLMMIDVDHFKLINDRYGHVTGDKVLAHIASTLTERLRKQDIIARYGGEEFCILLPATDEKGAAATGEALRLAIENTPLDHPEQPIVTTVSIGISVYPLPAYIQEQPIEKLLENADAALYQAKRTGRNRVVFL